MMYFCHQYPLVHTVQKQAFNAKKCAPGKSVETRSMFKFSLKKRMPFWHQLRKMMQIYPGTDDLWQAENWSKLVSSL